MDLWLAPFDSPLDVVGFVLFVLVFPIYHAAYPVLMRYFPGRAAKERFDLFRRSWIEGLIARRDVIAAAQQTRNLTMVNSLLASSALILMGLTANLLVRQPQEGFPVPALGGAAPAAGPVVAKLYLLIVVFAVAFSYCMTSLRHLGHFTLVIGADPRVVEELEGPSVDYFTTLINRASNRYTLAIRSFFSAFPIFAWIFDPWLFLGLTLFWGVKFIAFQDFSHVLRRQS